MIHNDNVILKTLKHQDFLLWLKLVDIYLKYFPLKSNKGLKINLIKDFYMLEHRSNLSINRIDKFNQWIQFKNKWDKII